MCVLCGWFVFSGVFFFFKQKTADEMRISDGSSDVCSSDLEVLESTLEAERLVGIEENVEILPGDGGGFLRVRYPEDSINFSSADEETPLGGAAFYASVGRSKVSCLHYRVRFPEDFDFNKGGKLPGDRKSTRLTSSH